MKINSKKDLLDYNSDLYNQLHSTNLPIERLKHPYIENGESILLLTSIIALICSMYFYSNSIFGKLMNEFIQDPRMHVIDAMFWSLVSWGFIAGLGGFPILILYYWSRIKKKILVGDIYVINPFLNFIFLMGGAAASGLNFLGFCVILYFAITEGAIINILLYLPCMLIYLYHIHLFFFMFWQLLTIHRAHKSSISKIEH